MKGATLGVDRFAKMAVAVGVVAVALVFGVPQAVGASMTPQQPKLMLVPGADSSPVCTSYPCATVSVSGSGTATIALGLGKEAVEEMQPETYYTDLVRVTNPTGSNVTITAVTVGGVSEARQGDIGGITVYFCTSQTDDPSQGCAGSFTISSPTGGTAFRGAAVISPGGSGYIELAGFAGLSAHSGDRITFTIEVTAE